MMKHKMLVMALLLVFLLTGCAAPESTPGETEILFTATEAPPAATETAPVTEPAPQIITPVEITLDNWQEYFELRQTEQVYMNESCAVSNRVFGYGVFLKDEFVPLLAPGSDVSFELQYELVWRRVMGDLNGNSYLIQDINNEHTLKTQTAGMTDFRGDPSISEESDFYNRVAVEFAFDSEFGA